MGQLAKGLVAGVVALLTSAPGTVLVNEVHLDYVPELAKFDAASQRRILSDNTRELTGLRPG